MVQKADLKESKAFAVSFKYILEGTENKRLGVWGPEPEPVTGIRHGPRTHKRD